MGLLGFNIIATSAHFNFHVVENNGLTNSNALANHCSRSNGYIWSELVYLMLARDIISTLTCQISTLAVGSIIALG